MVSSVISDWPAVRAQRAAIADFGAATGTFSSRLTEANRSVACVEADPTLPGPLARWD
jgi:hypothetical protein